MAIKSESSETPPNRDPQEPMRHSMGVETAPGISELDAFGVYGMFGQSPLSPDVEKCLEEVTKNFELQPGFRKECNFRRIQLQDPRGGAGHAFVVTSDNREHYASIVLFAEPLMGTLANNMPIAIYAPMTKAALLQVEPKCHVVNFYVITRADYYRSGNLGRAIGHDLIPLLSSNVRDLRVNNFVANAEYVLSHDVEMARQLERSVSPHDVAPRIDIGFVLSLRKERTQGGIQQSSFSDQLNMQPVLAVGAFVEMVGPEIDPRTGVSKFYPVVRISSVTSLFPIAGALMLALTVAAEYYIKNQGWKRQYTRFARGTPNLGNLSPKGDNSNELFSTDDQMALDNYATNFCYDPFLAMDVVVGRSRVPAMYLFADPNGWEQLKDEAGKFFNASTPVLQASVCALANLDWIGVYGSPGGKMSDSRDVTYLEQVAAHGPLDPQVTSALTHYSSNPAERASAVANRLGGTFQSLYEDHLVLINPEFYKWIQGVVARSGLKLFDPNAPTTVIPLGSFSGVYNNVANFGTLFSRPSRPQFGNTNIFG